MNVIRLSRPVAGFFLIETLLREIVVSREPYSKDEIVARRILRADHASRWLFRSVTQIPSRQIFIDHHGTDTAGPDAPPVQWRDAPQTNASAKTSRTPPIEMLVEYVRDGPQWEEEWKRVNSEKEWEKDIRESVRERRLQASLPSGASVSPRDAIEAIQIRTCSIHLKHLRPWLAKKGLAIEIEHDDVPSQYREQPGPEETPLAQEAATGEGSPIHEITIDSTIDEESIDAAPFKQRPAWIETPLLAEMLNSLGGKSFTAWKSYLSDTTRAEWLKEARRSGLTPTSAAEWNPVAFAALISQERPRRRFSSVRLTALDVDKFFAHPRMPRGWQILHNQVRVAAERDRKDRETWFGDYR